MEYRTKIDGCPMVEEIIKDEPGMDIFGDYLQIGTTVQIAIQGDERNDK